MTATSHYIDSKQETRATAEALGVDAVVRLILRFIGVALIFASMGMWLAPGATFDGDLILMKLGVSLFFAITGLTLFCSGNRTTEPEAAEE